MAALRELLLDFGVKLPTRDLKKADRQVEELTKDTRGLDRSLEGLSGTLSGIGAALATAFAGDFVRDQIQNVAQIASETRRLAGTVNVSTQEFAGWSRAMGNFGVEADDVQDILKEMQIKAREAIADNDPTTGYGESFARIGISLDELRPRVNNASELLQFFTSELEQVDDMALRSFAIDELFSDAGTRATEFFNQGSAAIQRQRQEQERQARSTILLANKMQAVNRILINGKRAWEDLWATLALKYLPKFTQLMELSGRAIKIIKDLAVNTDFLEKAMVAVGIAAAAAAGYFIASWLAALGPIGLAAIGLAALFLLFDDMKSAIEGDRSALKNFLDETIGMEKSKSTIQFLRDAWEAIGTAIGHVVDGYRTLINFGAGLLGAEGPVMRGETGETRGVAGRTFRGGRSVRRFFGGIGESLGMHEIAEVGAQPPDILRMRREEKERRDAYTRARREEIESRAALATIPEIEIANIEQQYGAAQSVMPVEQYRPPEGYFYGGLNTPINVDMPMTNTINISSTEPEAAAEEAIRRLEERENQRLTSLQRVVEDRDNQRINNLQRAIPENRP